LMWLSFGAGERVVERSKLYVRVSKVSSGTGRRGTYKLAEDVPVSSPPQREAFPSGSYTRHLLSTLQPSVLLALQLLNQVTEAEFKECSDPLRRC
jgi:hypothetical protein